MHVFERGRFFNNFKYSLLKDDEEIYWSERDRKRWIICLFFLTSLLFAALVTLPVCANALAVEFGWSKADLGIAMGSFFWGCLTTQVLGGYIAERVGGDKVICVSVIMWGSVTAMTPYIAHYHSFNASTLTMFTVGRVVLGISQGVYMPSVMSLLCQKIPKAERSLPNAVILSASNFGTLVCGGVGSLMLEHHHGWKNVFYVVAFAAFAWLYFLFSLLRNTQNKVISLQRMVFTQPTINTKRHAMPWNIILKQSSMWSIIFAHVCMSNCYYILLSWLPTYFYDNFPNEKGWVYNTVPWIMAIPASILSEWLSEKLVNSKWSIPCTRKLIQAIAMIGSAFFGVLLPLCTNFSTALLCATGATSTLMFHNSRVLTMPQDIAPTYEGPMYGVVNGFGALQSFVGVYVTGYILYLSNNWFLVFLIMALFNIIGLFVFIFAGKGDSSTNKILQL